MLGAGLVGMVGLAWTTGRHLWFYSDDWNILTGYHQGRLLEPFNGHLSLIFANLAHSSISAESVSSRRHKYAN